MLTRMIEVDELNAFGEDGAEVGQLSRAPSVSLTKPLSKYGFYLLGQHRLQAGFVPLGHACHPHRG